MGSVEKIFAGDVIDDANQFFAPMSADLVDGLIGQYNTTRARISAMAQAVRSEQCHGVLHYFVEGNVSEQRHTLPKAVDQLFRVEGAIAQLNADFWNRALRLTDVLDYMPQARREEWFEQIRNPEGRKANRHTGEKDMPALPEFEEQTVRATLGGLLANRAQFLAERVDGIFRALSRQHVTNQPQGFGKRMIIQNVFSYQTHGHINDLRCVIAKFMGRDEPKYGATDPVTKAASRQNGQWMTVDGGALRIRVYGGVGTAHLEVHPDMAWRLNGILASMYPAAIPAEFRTKPKRAKKIKDFELFDRPLPFAVVGILAGMRQASERIKPDWPERYRDIPNALRFDYGQYDKAAMAEAENVLVALGGVKEKGYWQFDYHPREVLDQVVCSGCIPDHKSHQFYPTPAGVAEKAIEFAKIGQDHTCLEPSAGQGGLADLMPSSRTICVEISDLHCQILKAKGHVTMQADFLQFVSEKPFDRIVMNPPFSEGRWQAHLQHAASMLNPVSGRLIAILPATTKGKQLLEGFDHEYSQVFENEFSGTSVSVVILAAEVRHG
ncbi:DUF4942 domain-containing protein [Pseudomonas sp. HS-18]|uniref:DUF4942 domain-containing protein n=1 Tax=Pseudomonas sp. HS-18 TaxID=2879114 RepID=UPI001CF0A75E|nr:DUF4942 domain-containing protein [Pseudomonas sp. HS-18]UCL89305.1 DUF4942 domain-containing protein [Pseudomonas sp. HS-18]